MIKNITQFLGACCLIEVDHYSDNRGLFSKFYSEEEFDRHGINMDVKEQFYTTSKKNVIRGMHFQIPPYHHDKLVTCVSGSVIDVVLDLRKSSASYGKFESFKLDSENKSIIYIPKGFAHGFLSNEENTSMMYAVSSIHSPDHDQGILWNSFGFDWQCKDPIISERDKNHVLFEDFSTVF